MRMPHEVIAGTLGITNALGLVAAQRIVTELELAGFIIIDTRVEPQVLIDRLEPEIEAARGEIIRRGIGGEDRATCMVPGG